MREIKYRALDRNDGKVKAVAQIDYLVELVQFIGESGWVDFNNAEIMQYTGLKDKSGREIYEGDVLSITYFLTDNKGIVKFGKYKQIDMSSDYECGNQGFYVDVTNDMHGTFRHDLYFYAAKSEVVGNIYDNPELLGGKKSD